MSCLTQRFRCNLRVSGSSLWRFDGILTYPLSYREVCEMLRDRGVSVAPSTVMRRVLRYAPEFETYC
jgi:transposase-like protein